MKPLHSPPWLLLTVDACGETLPVPSTAEKIHSRGVCAIYWYPSQETGHDPAAHGAESALGAELGSELLVPNVGFGVFTFLLKTLAIKCL